MAVKGYYGANVRTTSNPVGGSSYSGGSPQQRTGTPNFRPPSRWDSIPSTTTRSVPTTGEYAGLSANAAMGLQMARSMQAAGQISGGLSGGTYTKGPVAYDESFYTPKGWQEVYDRGWSSQLSDKGRSNILFDQGDPSTIGGYLQNLPEGQVYSTNIGNPKRGWGGYRWTDPIESYNDQGGGWGGYGGYGGGGGGSGGGGGGGYTEEPFMPRGYPGELWGPQMPLQQAMVDIHGGREFRQGFSRGGIVSLVT
jgi:hypothetical protein